MAGRGARTTSAAIHSGRAPLASRQRILDLKLLLNDPWPAALPAGTFQESCLAPVFFTRSLPPLQTCSSHLLAKAASFHPKAGRAVPILPLGPTPAAFAELVSRPKRMLCVHHVMFVIRYFREPGGQRPPPHGAGVKPTLQARCRHRGARSADGRGRT